LSKHGPIQVLDASGEIINSENCSFSGLEETKGFLLRAAVAYLTSLQTSSNPTEPKNPDIQRAISTLKMFIREPGEELGPGMTARAGLIGLEFSGLRGQDMMMKLFRDLNFDHTIDS
jgi:hypothetical protein